MEVARTCINCSGRAMNNQQVCTLPYGLGPASFATLHDMNSEHLLRDAAAMDGATPAQRCILHDCTTLRTTSELLRARAAELRARSAALLVLCARHNPRSRSNSRVMMP